MSTINRFLSRKDKHAHGSHKDKVNTSLESPPSRGSTIASSSMRSRRSTSSSLSSVSLAFSDLKPKRSPRLQATIGTVECSCANLGTLILQPRTDRGALNGLFVTEQEHKRHEKDEDRKIRSISHRLSRAGINNWKEADIVYVLNGAYASGDVDKAYELLVLLEDSEEGIIQSYNPDVKLLGAINREGVTCYLDALLFAMFARLGSFEAMLYKNFEDPPRKKLATLLRLWVNTLRAGKLITTDITKQIQLQLAECGWKDAAELCQQDASEAFTFITSTLALPLLTLKMDIFHTGREDIADDHKFVNERLLELALPEDTTDGHIITLEECLELFFNNKIEVKRYLDMLERRNTLNSIQSRRSIDSTKKGHASHIEVAEFSDISQPSSPVMPPESDPIPMSPRRPTFQRNRAPSIIQETYISEKNAVTFGSPQSIDEKGPQPGRVRKEVMMPAWQFFSLIPWYTNNMPSSDAQVAAHFSSTRPILGICLKRYGISLNGTAFKRTTHIDIPLEIGLPHFIQDDKMAEDGPAFGNFKLSLQSVVCHKGLSVESGHYISLVRSPDPHQQGEDRWLRFDDLARDRVTDTNVGTFLREESPYLLFYQVVPIEGDPGNIAEGERPPAYSRSDISQESTIDSGVASLDSRATYSANGHSQDETQRPSVEIRRPSTDTSTSDGPRGRSSMQSERANSIAFSDTSGPSPRPGFLDTPNPDLAQIDGPNALTASRRGSKATKGSSKSRPNSRADDTRKSTSLSRLASRMSRDKMNVPAMPQAQPFAPTQTDKEDGIPNPPPHQVKSPPTGTMGPPAPLVAESEKPADGGKLKKEAKEKSKAAHRDHQHLIKARRKDEKPDRECSVM